MDMHELARMIALEVLNQLQGHSTRQRIMVLAENRPGLAQEICEQLGCDAEIVFLGEEDMDLPIDRYILPTLSCRCMAALATGGALDTLQEKILALLLAGKCVEVLAFEYKGFSQTAPWALYSLYQSYEKALYSYGLKAFAPQAPDTIRSQESLITEETIRQAGESGASVLLVPAPAIVTPLAAEAAKKLHITIQKE